MTSQSIIAEIDAYMQKFRYQNPAWYVGIASDAVQRLFTDHAVDQQKGAWIYRHADTSTVARAVEMAYHTAGCDGGPGGGDADTVTVYAYLKTTTTDP